jgi:hypothetical protein
VVGVGVNDVPIVGEPIAYGAGFIALLVVAFAGAVGQYFHTYAHEGGHMLAAVATLRPLDGYWIYDNTEGLTTIPKIRWALSNLVFLAAGYLAPPLLGLGGAALIAAGNPWAVLMAAVVLSLLALLPARNALAFTIPLLVLLGVGFALVEGSATAQATLAVALVWFLLITGTREAFKLPSTGGDAASLAGRTLIPGVIWKVFWAGVSVLALIVGAQLLLRPGYSL